MQDSSEEAQYNDAKVKKLFNKLKSLFGFKTVNTLKESLEEVIEEHNANGDNIDHEEKALLRNVLTFSGLEVEDVMIPRADIVSVNKDIELEELKKIIVEKAHTRLPVCHKSLDDVIGFIHVKDLVSTLSSNEPFKIDKIIREVLFVPPSMKVNDLLVKMQITRLHIAIVIDEYGGTTGLVTLEDLVEEIVGEIEDEHDISNENKFKRLGKNLYEASARIDVKELEDKLKINLTNHIDDSEDFDTLGGLIFNMLDRVPAVGEVAKHQAGIEFEIKEADARHIKRVLIKRK